MADTQRHIVLKHRPEGAVKTDDFDLREAPKPECPPNGLVLRNTYLAIDPAIRQWISGRGRYMVPILPGDTVRSVVLGKVVESRMPDVPTGVTVRALGSWSEFSVITQRDFPFVLPRRDGLPQTAHLGVAGNTGLAAYFGLFDVARPRTEETIVISAAAGGVGSVVGQLAREAGCRVVGLAGTEEKRQWLIDACGFDVAEDYHGPDLRARLKQACPGGIDIFFDNVGGPVLETALGLLKRNGRVVICGATAQYDIPPEEIHGPANYLALLETGGTMQGFMASHYLSYFPEGLAYLRERILDGRLVYREEIRKGLDKAPEALTTIFNGQAFGRVLVKV